MEGYIIKVVCFQALFLAVYWLFFRQSTFFKIHRVYLMAAPILALLLPFIKISAFQTAVPEQLTAIFLPEVVIGSQAVDAVIGTQPAVMKPLSLLWLYYSGVIVSLIIFSYKISRLWVFLKFRRASEQLIEIPKSTEAFTFFNYIFIGEEIHPLSRKHILAHEQIHVAQRHTWDLLAFEVLRIAMWFNPLVYIYQKEISHVHEYLADEAALSQTTKQDYYEKLLNTAFGTNNLSFINTFFNHSSIKNRIVMLQKSKSTKTELVKYLLVIPTLLSMLFYVSCSDDYSTEKETALEEQIIELKVALEEKDNLSTEELEKLQVLVEKVNEKDRTTKTIYDTASEDNLHETVTITEVENLTNDSSIPFSVVEKTPVFPGCDRDAPSEEQKECFHDKINQWVAQNFDASVGDKLGFEGVQKIYTLFKIAPDGTVVDVKARASHPALQEEAERTVKSLPKMDRGAMQKGKLVTVSYTLPIIFKIEE